MADAFRGPPGLRVGRYIKFRPEDVEAWLERQYDDREDTLAPDSQYVDRRDTAPARAPRPLARNQVRARARRRDDTDSAA